MEQYPQKTIFDITTRSFVRAILVALGFVFLYVVRDILAVVLFSVVVASAVDPAARWFGRFHIPRVVSVILVYLIAFLVLAGAFYIVVPTLISETSQFISDAPSLLHGDFLSTTVLPLLPDLPSSFSGLLDRVLAEAQGAIGSLTAGFLGTAVNVFGGAVLFGLLIVLSFYLSVQENGIEGFLRVVTPQEHEQYILDVWRRARRKIGRWLQGQVLLGVLVGVLVWGSLFYVCVLRFYSRFSPQSLNSSRFLGRCLPQFPPSLLRSCKNPSLVLQCWCFMLLCSNLKTISSIRLWCVRRPVFRRW